MSPLDAIAKRFLAFPSAVTLVKKSKPPLNSPDVALVLEPLITPKTLYSGVNL